MYELTMLERFWLERENKGMVKKVWGNPSAIKEASSN
jgi:hypothetical protein